MQRIITASVILLFAVLVFLLAVRTDIAKAAIRAFSPSTCYTNAATSSPAYMTPGTATSTVSCYMGGDGAASAVVALQANASSTNTYFDFFVEESMDNQDWYPISPNQIASTSPQFNVTTQGSVRWIFASSTIGATGLGAGTNYLGVSGTNNRNHVSFNVPVRMQRVRVHAAIVSNGSNGLATSTNGAIWMQILPRIEIN